MCKVIFMSNPTFVELCYVVLELFWGCGWGFDNLDNLGPKNISRFGLGEVGHHNCEDTFLLTLETKFGSNPATEC